MAALLASAFACIPTVGLCADIYESRSVDGTVRYATQRLDASYAFIASDSPPASRTAPSHAKASSPIRDIIQRIAARHGIDAVLVEAIAHVESRLQAHAVSPRGAQGVMQLMPATAQRYGVHGARRLKDPETNIDAGVRHFKDLLAAHEGNVALALAAYNAGGGAVQRHGSRIPPYPETMLYVPSVLAHVPHVPQ